MKTVLPMQGTGPIEFGGVGLAITIALGLVLLFVACLWGIDCYRLVRRGRTIRAEPCAEDKNLDRMAAEVDRHLDERERRRQPPPERPTAPPNRLEPEGMFHGPRRRRAC